MSDWRRPFLLTSIGRRQMRALTIRGFRTPRGYWVRVGDSSILWRAIKFHWLIGLSLVSETFK